MYLYAISATISVNQVRHWALNEETAVDRVSPFLKIVAIYCREVI